MTLHRARSAARGRWRLLTIYQKFEHAVISLLREQDRRERGAGAT
jgi:hypothetical protein